MDIAEWLGQLDLAEYADHFLEHRIDEAVLPSLNDTDLKEIGCHRLGDRRKLLRAIEEKCSATEEFAVGTMVADRYQIDQELGSRAKTNIYIAFDTKLNHQKLLIKALKPELRDNALEIQRFKDETLISQRLASDFTIKFFHYDCPNGQPIMLMEYLDGTTLDDCRYRYRELGNRVPLETIQSWVPQLVNALTHIHTNRVLHLDIKPSNLMLTKDEQIKVVDFGYAEIMQESDGNWIVPKCRGGTFDYFSPEQNFDWEMDWRSDLYALTASIYKLLANKLPFNDETIKEGNLDQAFEPIADQPDFVNEALRKGLRQNKEDRFKSLQQFENALMGDADRS